MKLKVAGISRKQFITLCNFKQLEMVDTFLQLDAHTFPTQYFTFNVVSFIFFSSVIHIVGTNPQMDSRVLSLLLLALMLLLLAHVLLEICFTTRTFINRNVAMREMPVTLDLHASLAGHRHRRQLHKEDIFSFAFGSRFSLIRFSYTTQCFCATFSPRRCVLIFYSFFFSFFFAFVFSRLFCERFFFSSFFWVRRRQCLLFGRLYHV